MKPAAIAVCFFLVVCTLPAAGAVRLPRLIRDSMILQRDTRIRCWGWASPGERVTLRFNGQQLQATTAADSTWTIWIPPMKAGGPYTLTIDAFNHITLHDVLVGDVWVCSGQSNMVHQMALHSDRYAADITSAFYPQIRQFWIPTLTDLQQPHNDLPTGYWKSANPTDVRDFSAIAFFFARALYHKYHVPIGLINASVGGTPAQAWISGEGLKAFPDLAAIIQKNKDTAYINSLLRRPAARGSRTPAADKGLNSSPHWYDTTYRPVHWRSITVPGYWEDQGAAALNGTVWYRREIDVPAAMAAGPAKLVLGRIVDADVVYVNGKQVGQTTYMYPQRRYLLPAGTLRPGKNLVVVRITNHAGKGGFVPDKPYCLVAGNDTLDLKGTWQYKVGEAFAAPQFQQGFSAQNNPTALYNAMLAPVTRYTIKGILWYQGESNTGNPSQYAQLMPALVNDWRRQWQQGDIPFLYVQLPGFGDIQYLPSESQWAATREAQQKTLVLPRTGMAVAIDLGEWNDIHPDRKKEVGERLALLAEQLAYHEQGLVASGPLFRSAAIEGNRIVLSFNYTGSGLTTSDGEPPAAFAIAGADKKFVWAQARIEGDKVTVWSDAVAAPRYVRYAWADMPDNPNLCNKEGLPAAPFRTDE
jgi:sialate O-acetylesterase